MEREVNLVVISTQDTRQEHRWAILMEHTHLLIHHHILHTRPFPVLVTLLDPLVANNLCKGIKELQALQGRHSFPSLDTLILFF